MKFKRHIKLEQSLEQINLAPMIDVILLLLIFFMLSSSFTFQSGINVKLPKTVISDTLQDDNFIITITSENIVYLANSIITIEELKQILHKSNTKIQTVLIKADRRASMGRIVDIWDLCREFGIERINIATDQKK